MLHPHVVSALLRRLTTLHVHERMDMIYNSSIPCTIEAAGGQMIKCTRLTSDQGLLRTAHRRTSGRLAICMTPLFRSGRLLTHGRSLPLYRCLDGAGKAGFLSCIVATSTRLPASALTFRYSSHTALGDLEYRYLPHGGAKSDLHPSRAGNFCFCLPALDEP